MPLQDVQDLPDFIDSHYKEVTKEILGLKNKLQEIEAIEKYYEIRELFLILFYICTERKCSQIKLQLHVEIESGRESPEKPNFINLSLGQ